MSLPGRHMGRLLWFLVFRLELTGLFLSVCVFFEPLSEYNISVDIFQRFGGQRMKIHL